MTTSSKNLDEKELEASELFYSHGILLLITASSIAAHTGVLRFDQSQKDVQPVFI